MSLQVLERFLQVLERSLQVLERSLQVLERSLQVLECNVLIKKEYTSVVHKMLSLILSLCRLSSVCRDPSD